MPPGAPAVVALGGVLGSTARWALTTLYPVADGGFPWTTLVINLVGCLAIGLVAGRLLHRQRAFVFVVTGVLGGFTTFSTFAVGTDQMLRAGQTAGAFAYVVASVGGGLAAVVLGRSAGRARPHDWP